MKDYHLHSPLPPPKRPDRQFNIQYVSFHIDDWARDTREYPHLVRSAYLSAIIDYMKFGCVGLKNDTDHLQRICECNEKEWKYCAGIIFGEFFKLSGDRWHQKRAKIEYGLAKEAWSKQVSKSSTGGLSRSRTANRSEGGRFV